MQSALEPSSRSLLLTESAHMDFSHGDHSNNKIKKKVRTKMDFISWLTSPPTKHLPKRKQGSSNLFKSPLSATKTNEVDTKNEECSPLSKIGSNLRYDGDLKTEDKRRTSSGSSGWKKRRRRALQSLQSLIKDSKSTESSNNNTDTESQRDDGRFLGTSRGDCSSRSTNDIPKESPLHFSLLLEDCKNALMRTNEGRRDGLHSNGVSNTTTPAVSCETTPRRTTTNSSQISIDASNAAFVRLFVLETQLVTDGQPQTVCRVMDERTDMEKIVVLRDDWTELVPQTGDYIHVKSPTQNEPTILIDAESGILILHPDHLISVTTIAESFSCVRKSILQTRAKARDVNIYMIFGVILHELFDEALRQKDFSTAFLHKHCKKLVSGFVDELWALQKSENEVFQMLKPSVASMQDWSSQFLADRLRNQSSAIFNAATNATNASCVVDAVHNIEESIWSHSMGIKGNVDVSVDVEIKDFKGSAESSRLAPLELKTGNSLYSVDSHRAQTMMYSLLLSDRYDTDVQYGVIAYISRNDNIIVPFRWNEARRMIIMRNTLASYMVSGASWNSFSDARGLTAASSFKGNKLPPIIKNDRLCEKCNYMDSCVLYHKLSGPSSESGFSGVVADAIATKFSHLEEKHINFFEYWDTVLTLEEPDPDANIREFYTLSSHQRQMMGTCLNDLMISEYESAGVGDNEGTERNFKFSYTFCKLPLPSGVVLPSSGSFGSLTQQQAFSIDFRDSQFNEGDPVVVSVESPHHQRPIRKGTGFVSKLHHDQITVVLDKMIAMDNPVVRRDPSCDRYRVDVDSFSSGLASVRHNIVSLMTDPRCRRLLRLLVDKVPPEFGNVDNYNSVELEYLENLNESQKKAVDVVLGGLLFAIHLLL